MDKSGNRQTIFKFVVFHTVPADEHHVGFPQLVDSALDDVAQHGQIHALCGKTHEIHGGFGHPAHGIDIAEGVGRGDLAEPVRIVHYGCKKIHGLNQSQLFGDFVYAGIVRTRQPNQYVGVGGKFKSTQSPLQIPWRQFGGSTGTGDGLGQSYWFLIGHNFIFPTYIGKVSIHLLERKDDAMKISICQISKNNKPSNIYRYLKTDYRIFRLFLVVFFYCMY